MSATIEVKVTLECDQCGEVEWWRKDGNDAAANWLVKATDCYAWEMAATRIFCSNLCKREWEHSQKTKG